MLRYAIIGILTVAFIKGISLLLKKSKPRQLSETSGTIRPVRWIVWVTIIIGGAMVFGALYGYLANEFPWKLALILGLLGAAAGGFMALSLSSRHDVTWDTRGISGPSRMLGPSLGFRRTTHGWGDIVETGKTATGYWFVEAQNGERVYWSYLYGGYGALTQILKAQRPDLKLPDDL